MQHVSCPLTTTEDPVRLTEEFPKWLEKVSSRLAGGIILVIDAVDLCQVFTSMLCSSSIVVHSNSRFESVRFDSLDESIRIDSRFPKKRTVRSDHSLESVCNIWLWLYCRCYNSRHKDRKNECQDINLPPPLRTSPTFHHSTVECRPAELNRFKSIFWCESNRI